MARNRPTGILYVIRNQRGGIKPCVIDGVDLRHLFYNKVKAKCGSDFKRTPEDFERFKAIMGPVPKGMIRPTCGRLDHSMGYVYDTRRCRWNFEWQSMSDNNRDSANRRWHGG